MPVQWNLRWRQRIEIQANTYFYRCVPAFFVCFLLCRGLGLGFSLCCPTHCAYTGGLSLRGQLLNLVVRVWGEMDPLRAGAWWHRSCEICEYQRVTKKQKCIELPQTSYLGTKCYIFVWFGCHQKQYTNHSIFCIMLVSKSVLIWFWFFFTINFHLR